MIKQHSSFIKQLIAGIDCIFIFAAFYLSYNFTGLNRNLLPFNSYWIMSAGFCFFYLYFAWTRSLFSILDFNWIQSLYSKLSVIFLSSGILGAAVLYLVPENRNSRYLYITFVSFSFILISFQKTVLKIAITYIRRSNRNVSPVVFFGHGKKAAQIYHDITTHPEWGMKVVERLYVTTPPRHFESILKNKYIEEILFCIPKDFHKDGFSLEPYLNICDEMGRPARIFLNLPGDSPSSQWEYQSFLEHSTLISHSFQFDPDQLLFKRLFDIAGSCVGMFFFLITFPFFAVTIKLTSRGPVFFRQIRVGKRGKRIVVYKYRSMIANAEEKKDTLKSCNECEGAIFKLKNDPRVTRFGFLMRKFSLDELPQFINVLKGEMSLVGTRPPTPEEVQMYCNWHHRRISIKPGLTGLWQVSGRNKITDFNKIVKLDLKYIDNWSIWLDVKIILKTIPVLFKTDHAY
ncbi:sugar transferase [Chitinispirillales bacterium ANBcel5]|uniref:sugar transferase n=1 Tax=Cellulosispirillum alkaliphilum TaxID=3039283 RepID=UPI002A504689|nr:sugar transferase [Chitinispirillales bacterium ANBcel5]